MIINRIGAFSLARMLGTLYAIVGLLIGAVVSLAAVAGTFGSGETSGIPGVIMGAGAIVILPIVYACLGFITSWIGATLYNVLARMVGGVEMDVS